MGAPGLPGSLGPQVTSPYVLCGGDTALYDGRNDQVALRGGDPDWVATPRSTEKHARWASALGPPLASVFRSWAGGMPAVAVLEEFRAEEGRPGVAVLGRGNGGVMGRGAG